MLPLSESLSYSFNCPSTDQVACLTHNAGILIYLVENSLLQIAVLFKNDSWTYTPEELMKLEKCIFSRKKTDDIFLNVDPVGFSENVSF